MHLCDLPNDILLLIVRQVYVLYHEAQYSIHDICYGISPDSREHTTIYTNLDFVSSVGCLHLVNRVNIEVKSDIEPFQWLDTMIQRMRAAREQWDAVRTLHLDIDGRPFRSMDWDVIARSTQGIPAALTAMFPRVQRLSFYSLAYDPAVDRVAGRVAAHYADQLRTLRSGRVIVKLPGVVFRGLRDVSIRCAHKDRGELPHIDPTELRRLRLPSCPGDHSWAAFSADGDESQDIQFPRLRVLCLSSHQKPTTSWTDESKRKGRLHFPALKVLKVYCEDGVPHGLERGVFPKRIDRVDTASTSLTRLDASMNINLDAMVALIRRLPRLSSLRIRQVKAYDIPPGISVPEPGADRLVEPISTTLKTVRITFDCDNKNPEPAVLTLKYLLLAVPSLSTISVYDIPGDPMDGFVEDHANQYPHLARLRTNFHKLRC
ncbi:hypothetical protein H4R18_002169 [Coemansia javaensis]|uniref:F-box domain-containing protein n=1 Tax=Coemansia javaensis TaxID=2761396 RepID=A0A9W8LJ50_9FUNG|nr:hypothetical protein H4R18_002169 [Coemansia javaensis]